MAFLRYYRAAYPDHFRETVLKNSAENNLPPALVYAVIRTESGFDSDARSHVEARGLMQITKDTYEWAQFRVKEENALGFDALFDSEINIRYGTIILRLLLEEFDTVENALCAYHTGWGNMKKWLADPELSGDGVHLDRIPSKVTAYYVARVLETQEMYERLYQFDSI